MKDWQKNLYIRTNEDHDGDVYLKRNEELAKKENIQVKWMNYENYKEYEQLHPPFEHAVTILDLILNADATKFMKSFT